MIIKILLLCVTFVSINSQTCIPTTPDDIGPFYQNGAPFKNDSLCAPQTKGIPLIVSGRVTDEQCQRGIQAVLDVWQADDTGVYSEGKFNYACRSRVTTDPEGYYKFSTIFPAHYAGRPSHIHYLVEAIRDGGYGVFVTQLYFKNDHFLGEKDSCGQNCNSRDPNRYAEVKANENTWTLETTFNIVLKKLWREK